MRIGPIAMLALSAVLSVSCFACLGTPGKGTLQQAAVESKAPVDLPGVPGTVIGGLRQVGNAPHIETVITGVSDAFPDGIHEYYLVGRTAESLAPFFGKRVSVTGIISRTELKLAGSSGRTRERYSIEVQDISEAK